MTPKKTHVIAPKKSDAKKNDKEKNSKSSKSKIPKKLNEFGDTDSL